jgi:hypothetical protein
MLNPEKTYARASVLVAVVAIGLVFSPGLTDMDMMRGGYALSFVAFFVAASAAGVAVFFWRRAAMLDRLLAGKDVLAHWTYRPDEWQRYARAELKEQTMVNRGLLLVTTGLALAIGAVFCLLDREAGGVVFLVMVGLTVLLAGAAYGFPRLRYRHQRRGPGEAWLAPRAVYFNGMFVPWGSWWTRLERVRLKPLAAGQECLDFELSYLLGAQGRQVQNLRIPVPQGREAEARTILDHFVHQRS